MKRILPLLLIAMLLSGCTLSVLADPTDPKWDSVQVNHALQVQSDAMIVASFLIAGALGAAAWLLVTRRR
jgi:PBP1b-binding outer membrane lipoprotein LpoB